MSLIQKICTRLLRDDWKSTIEGDGGYCPCCDRWGKVYKMGLTQHLALCLRWIHVHGDKNDDGWVHVQTKAPRWMLRSKTYSTLEHWGLIESKLKRSGYWRTTPKAEVFMKSLIMVPSHVYVYNDNVWAVDSEETSFAGCFHKHFDFDEMMGQRFDWSNVKDKGD